MANNKNPLDASTNYMVKHIILAYQYTEDACAALPDLNERVGVPGIRLKGRACGGAGVVVINEFMSVEASVIHAETKWDFFSPVSDKTSSYVGTLNISDATGGYFNDTLQKYINTAMGGDAITRWTFVWRPVFIGSKEGDVRDVITPNPMVFHVTRFAQSYDEGISRLYSMDIVSSYNTLAMSPQFFKLAQCTITHHEGGLNNSAPDTAGATSGILPRQIEDSIKNGPRTNRQTKSKPMKNLQDIFKSVQVDVDAQKQEHRNQVQRWLKLIRDGFVDVVKPVKQKAKLPLKYTFKLDPKYNSYKVDNRNLPFEQPEQDQSQSGIRTLTLPAGSTIVGLCDKMMHLSRKVGEDHAKQPTESYRITSTHIRECSGDINITTRIDHHIPALIVPGGPDTSPGTHNRSGPIELEFQKAGTDDTDILSLASSSASDYGTAALEENSKEPDALAIYGEREQTTVERVPTESFFKVGFGGLRALTKTIMSIIGLESADDAAKIDNFIPLQQTRFKLEIRGNPHLLNDINRNPVDVVSGGDSWPYIIYDKPEAHPMYIKLTIYMKPASFLGGAEVGRPDEKYYFDGHLHITSITNRFVGSNFSQYIECARSDKGM